MSAIQKKTTFAPFGINEVLANGTYAYAAGAAATVNVPAGAFVIGVYAHATAAGATLTINGGASIPIPAGASFSRAYMGQFGDGAAIVFIGTDSYFVDYVTP